MHDTDHAPGLLLDVFEIVEVQIMVGDLPHEVLAVWVFLLQGAAGQVQQIGPGHELDIFVVRQIEMFFKARAHALQLVDQDLRGPQPA